MLSNVDTSLDRRTRNRTRLVMVLILIIVAVGPFVPLLLSQIPFIYNRHYNRIKAQIEKLPETRIIDSWRHEDISLEDFGFDFQVRQCPPMRLDFYEGEDWDRPFGVIDGITFSKPYNPATNGYETIPVSCEELDRAGIRVRTLADIVSRLEAVLAYLKSRPRNETDSPRAGAYYIRIYYDLDAYKQIPLAKAK
jgi:hypothetical protein